MKKVYFIGVIVSMLSLFGCSVESMISKSEYDIYSRMNTVLLCSSDSFGYGRDDDVTVALDFIYSNKDIERLCGSDFEIAENDVVCNNSEGETLFLKKKFKGEADYSFKIDKAIYRIKLSKDYDSKWKVISCELENIN